MESIQASKKTKKCVRKLKRDLELHSDDKVIQLLLSNYKDMQIINQDVQEQVESSQQEIKQRLLDLMHQHPNKTWLLPEFAGNTMEWLKIDYNKAKKYIEPLLNKIPGIIKVGDNCYRLKDSR